MPVNFVWGLCALPSAVSPSAACDVPGDKYPNKRAGDEGAQSRYGVPFPQRTLAGDGRGGHDRNVAAKADPTPADDEADRIGGKKELYLLARNLRVHQDPRVHRGQVRRCVCRDGGWQRERRLWRGRQLR